MEHLTVAVRSLFRTMWGLWAQPTPWYAVVGRGSSPRLAGGFTMRAWLLVGTVGVFTLGACGGSVEGSSGTDEVSSASTGELGLHGAPEHPFNDKDHAHSAGPPRGGSALMTAHGGTVLATNNTYAI